MVVSVKQLCMFIFYKYYNKFFLKFKNIVLLFIFYYNNQEFSSRKSFFKRTILLCSMMYWCIWQKAEHMQLCMLVLIHSIPFWNVLFKIQLPIIKGNNYNVWCMIYHVSNPRPPAIYCALCLSNNQCYNMLSCCLVFITGVL